MHCPTPINTLMTAKEENTMQNSQQQPATPFPGFFVDTSWLENHLSDPGLRIIQVGGEKYYPQFHIPGASFLPYQALVTLQNGVPGMRADTAFLAELFGHQGLTIDTPVVAYDLSGGMDASRLIWTLTALGHRFGAVLDGGLGSWSQEKRPVDHQTPSLKPVTFLPQPQPAWEASERQVLAAAAPHSTTLLLDTRTANEYLGLSLRAPRGHIAGALPFNWTDALLSDNDSRLKDKQTLLSLLAEVDVTDLQQEIIVYCETGHRASQSWLLLRQLGFSNVRLYDGSIAEWRVRQHPVIAGQNPRSSFSR